MTGVGTIRIRTVYAVDEKRRTSTMKRMSLLPTFVVGAFLGLATLALPLPADARVNVSIGIGDWVGTGRVA
jgi:hypothetical protein